VGTALISELNTYINSKDSSKSASATAAKSGTQIISDLTAYVKATDATNSQTASSTTVTATTADMLKQYFLNQKIQSGGTFFDAASNDTTSSDATDLLTQKIQSAMTSYNSNSKYID
jgi:prophage DNA circulation protein